MTTLASTSARESSDVVEVAERLAVDDADAERRDRVRSAASAFSVAALDRGGEGQAQGDVGRR